MITYDIHVLMGSTEPESKRAIKCHDTGVNFRIYPEILKKISKLRTTTEPYAIPAGSVAVLKVAKADKTYVLTEAKSVDQDSIYFEPHPQTFTAAGRASVEVNIFGEDGRRITTGTFYLDITKECTDDCAEDSETYVSVMAQQILDAQGAADRAEKAADRAEAVSLNPPKLSENSTWMVWNAETGEYTDTGVKVVNDGYGFSNLKRLVYIRWPSSPNEHTLVFYGQDDKQLAHITLYDYYKIDKTVKELNDKISALEGRIALLESEVLPIKVTVTFMVDGEAYGEPVELDKGAALVYPEVAPTKDGYTFTGWDVAAGTEINEDTVVNAIFKEVTPVALYTAEDITFVGTGTLSSLTKEINDAGNLVVTLPAFTGDDAQRVHITTAGAPKTAHYIAYGIKISDHNNTGDNTNVFVTTNGSETRLFDWEIDCAKIQYSKTEITKQIVDASEYKFGEINGWSAVGENDKVIGLAINAWAKNTPVPAGVTIELQYIAFFDNEADAKNYVYNG